MAPTSSFMPELWELIVDHLKSSRDLRSSALSPRLPRFGPPAQTRLFRPIDLRITSPVLANRLAARGLRRQNHHSHRFGSMVESLYNIAHSSRNAEMSHFSSIGALVSLPTLRTVSFYGMRWKLSPLRDVLERVSPTVCNLSVTYCVPYDPLPDPGDPSMSRHAQRPVITGLDLCSVYNIPLPLVDAFDFSRLAHFKFCFRL
ncbi:hypothetical protein C8R45DRAFT_1099517 [Mycena sanguinolenta]|nr:hypothetical protein C8R45DRAFT_1099517 [Mycena sanguinolenta]